MNDDETLLLTASRNLRNYLESESCIVEGFDIPDEIWIPFCDAIEIYGDDEE